MMIININWLLLISIDFFWPFVGRNVIRGNNDGAALMGELVRIVVGHRLGAIVLHRVVVHWLLAAGHHVLVS